MKKTTKKAAKKTTKKAATREATFVTRDVVVAKLATKKARGGAVAQVFAGADPRRGGATIIKLTSAAARSLRDQLDAIIDD